METKRLTGNQVSLKTDNVDGEMSFSGYGAFFGNVDSYGDVIEKGAFRKTLASAKKSGDYPVMLAQHGYEGCTPVGIYTKMVEDDNGLYVEGKLANTQAGREIYELMKMSPRPAIKGLSIGYITKEAYFPTNDDMRKGLYPSGCERVIKSVDLFEVSIVTFPANKKATVTDVKSEDADSNSEEMQSTARAVYDIFKEEHDSNTLTEDALKSIKDAYKEMRDLEMFQELRNDF